MNRKLTFLLSNPNHTISCVSIQFFRQLSMSLSSPNSMSITSLCSNGQLREALVKMTIQGLEMKFEGYYTLINECINKRAFREGQRVHAHMIRTSYRPPMHLRTRLIVFYNKCECLDDARQVLDEMPMRNVVSWTAMISAYSKRGYASEACSLFLQMLRSGTEPNEFTFASVLTSCTGSRGFDLGRQIHSLIIKAELESHIFVGSSLLDMYAKSGRMLEARRVFNGLPERDVVSCTAILFGYAQLGLDEEALELFRQLHREGMNSNCVTYTSVLTALSGLAALDLGRQVHNHILRRELPSYVVLQNSLIDMYSKCGNLSYSRRIFDSMPERTVISWNVMLVGYGKHGIGKEVVKLFKLMKEEKKIRPDKITLLAVLSGCSHGGMEDIGMEFFYEMANGEYGIEPELEHYGCAVDLLGRSGRIKEAFEFVKSMPLEPTAAIWGSLLGACRVHSNIEIGEFAGFRLLEIEPENAGNYVILSNLFASAGRWEDVRTLRELMTEKAVIKEPGRSWVELDQVLHTFHASDRSHPRREEVSAKVRELSAKLKEVGYSPDIGCVLYDVDEEQKEKILLGHSEKMALAFGMICTPEGATVRVIKNLRICVDCHNFAKLVSKVYGREVSMRDKKRFHHIVGGICSCGDYWLQESSKVDLQQVLQLMAERSRSFLNNGRILLEDLIASSDGKSNPIRNYSASELMRATNNFDPSYIIQNCSPTDASQYHHSIHVYGGYKMFKGFLDDRAIIVKKFIGDEDEARSLAIRDIVISIQMSNHKNVLKLLGCCLEFPVPALVHEYAAKGVVSIRGGFGDNESLPWKQRLLIAKQLANALAYLHTAFPRPIIHRDLKPNCVFLDEYCVPKLCNFSLSITIPPKQLYAEDNPKGTFGYVDPTYMKSGLISEKGDVYSFGVLLLVFLTGQQALDTYEGGDYQSIVSYVRSQTCDGQFRKIVDPKVLGEIEGDKHVPQQHLQEFLALALLCTNDSSELRPEMIDVAKELTRIEKCMLP